MFYGNNWICNSVRLHSLCLGTRLWAVLVKMVPKMCIYKTKVLDYKKRWKNYHDDSGMLGKAVYHVSLFPLHRNSFLKCTDDLCFRLLLFTSKPVWGMIILVKCNKKKSMLTFSLSPMIKQWFNLYFALGFFGILGIDFLHLIVSDNY